MCKKDCIDYTVHSDYVYFSHIYSTHHNACKLDH
ncbi:hypothetical protein X975_22416, partial [Stegodyphus mimosarum]